MTHCDVSQSSDQAPEPKTLAIQPNPELDLNAPFRSRLVTRDSFTASANGRGIELCGTHARVFDRHGNNGLEGLFGNGPATDDPHTERSATPIYSYRLGIEVLRSDLIKVRLQTDPRQPCTSPTDQLPTDDQGTIPLPVDPARLNRLVSDEACHIATADGHIEISCGETVVQFCDADFSFSVDRAGRRIVAETAAAASVYWGYFAFPFGTIERAGRLYTTSALTRTRTEDYYGLGEQFTDLNKRRQRIELFNRDPANTLASRTYMTVPFFISTGGYGLLVNSYAPMTIDLGSTTNQAVGIEVEGSVLEYYILLGSPQEALRLYQTITGPAVVPPLWSFGLWLSTIRRYRNGTALMEVSDEIRAQRFPCDVLHIDPPWMGTDLTCTLEWGPDFRQFQRMINHLKDRRLHLCLWIAPYVPVGCALYHDGLKQGFFLRDAQGALIVNRGPMNFWSVPFVYLDFTRPAEERWIKGHYQRLFAAGVDVLKVDLGELGPDEAHYHNGMVGRQGHNYYTLAYQRAVYEATAEAHPGAALIWCRSGTTGSQRFPLHWAGDCGCDYENMAGQLRAILSVGMSGLVFFSHDIGGFTGRPTPELYARWFQFAMFTSHTRAHGGEPHEPWAYGDEVLKICRRYAAMRYSLLPHVYQASHRAVALGQPLVKPLVLDYPDDPNARNIDDQFLFCDTFMVAPVFQDRGARQVYLPAGRWWDFHSERPVDSRGEWVRVHCELEHLPLWVRDGAVVLRCSAMEFVDPAAMIESLTVSVYGNAPPTPIEVVLPDGTTAAVTVGSDRATIGNAYSTIPVRRIDAVVG